MKLQQNNCNPCVSIKNNCNPCCSIIIMNDKKKTDKPLVVNDRAPDTCETIGDMYSGEKIANLSDSLGRTLTGNETITEIYQLLCFTYLKRAFSLNSVQDCFAGDATVSETNGNSKSIHNLVIPTSITSSGA